jgi:cell division septation protein DedD
MTAEVRILVDHKDDVLQVPVQAIHEFKGETFCLVKIGEQYDTRQIVMGATNDKTVVIENGLSENDVVVLNPRRHEELLQLPDLPDVSKAIGKTSTADRSSAGGKSTAHSPRVSSELATDERPIEKSRTEFTSSEIKPTADESVGTTTPANAADAQTATGLEQPAGQVGTLPSSSGASE